MLLIDWEGQQYLPISGQMYEEIYDKRLKTNQYLPETERLGASFWGYPGVAHLRLPILAMPNKVHPIVKL